MLNHHYFIGSFVWIWICLGGDILRLKALEFIIPYHIAIPSGNSLVLRRTDIIIIRSYQNELICSPHLVYWWLLSYRFCYHHRILMIIVIVKCQRTEHQHGYCNGLHCVSIDLGLVIIVNIIIIILSNRLKW